MNGAGKPIVAVDVDGTLADYHVWFLRFAEAWFGKAMPAPTDINPGQPLWRFMGVTRASYRECKLAYRQGGLKRSMPCLPGAAGLLRWVRRNPCLRNMYGKIDRDCTERVTPIGCSTHGLGAEIWICTTRPYLRLDNIDPDTREWLRRNGIKYDALLFDPLGGDRKYHELFRQARGRVACVLEDLPEQADVVLSVRYRKLQVPVLLREQPYNQHYGRNWGQGDEELLQRWSEVGEVRPMIAEAVRTWRLRNE